MPLAAALPLSMLAGYALGSLPFAYWLGRMRGVDVTRVGTHNPGAANVFRRVSPFLGSLTLALDIAKAAGAVLIGRALDLDEGVFVVPGAMAVLGHWHSPFLGFRGGAGLAAAVGVALASAPEAGAIGFGIALLGIGISRNVGWSAGAGYVAALAAAVGFDDAWETIGAVCGLGLIVALRAQLWPSQLHKRAGSQESFPTNPTKSAESA